jgi:hypothetical protein
VETESIRAVRINHAIQREKNTVPLHKPGKKKEKNRTEETTHAAYPSTTTTIAS